MIIYWPTNDAAAFALYVGFVLAGNLNVGVPKPPVQINVYLSIIRSVAAPLDIARSVKTNSDIIRSVSSPMDITRTQKQNVDIIRSINLGGPI